MEDTGKLRTYPIVLFAFDRPTHTLKTLEALKENVLAQESHLIVFVDGVQSNDDSDRPYRNQKVKEIVQKESWCKTVEYHFATKNIGCRNSIINGISSVLEKYEAVIVLEDDIVTSPYFLNYMNLALSYYKSRKSVFSISGYNLPSSLFPIPKNYDYDVFVLPRLLNWGWGTWSDRWNNVNWSKEFIPSFLEKKEQVDAFNRAGFDLSRMLKEEYDEKSDAWDVQFAFTHFAEHAVSIVPKYSYTSNIGFDGSGTHCLKNSQYDCDLSLSVAEPRFIDILYEDKRIINSYFSHHYPKKRALWKKIINRISRMIGKGNIFVVKRKVYC